MSVLILKNIEPEGPGTIEDFLVGAGIPFRIVDLCRGELIPEPADYTSLVMLGGPMSVNEDDKYPYIKTEEELTRRFLGEGKPVLGVCLGAQIMAKALGSPVYRGQQKEIGWYDITLTGEGLADPLMKQLAVRPGSGDLRQSFKVFHWHGETFDIPVGAARLASSALFPNQAFRYGAAGYAFQFHIEVRKKMVYDWLRDEAVDFEAIRTDTEEQFDEYTAAAGNFYRSFFDADYSLRFTRGPMRR